MIDGKPLPVGGASGDREAKAGRAVGGCASGYKLHAILSPQGELADWQVEPMNVDERAVAAKLIPDAGIGGYLVADANHDSNPLHALCDTLGELHLATPRRYGRTAKGVGHGPQTAGRRRLVERLVHPSGFAQDLLEARGAVERHFANLSNWGGGPGPLPAWVRTLNRVRRWVAAKLALAAVKRQPAERTYVT